MFHSEENVTLKWDTTKDEMKKYRLIKFHFHVFYFTEMFVITTVAPFSQFSHKMTSVD